MRKRLVFIIIAIAIAVLSSVQTIYADEEIDMTTNKAVTIEQSEDGWMYYVVDDAVYYNDRNQTNEDSVIIITGYTGDDEIVTVPAEIDGYKVDSIDLISSDYVKEVKISEGIIGISNYAFANCSELRRVICGSTVEYVGEYAFAHCPHLNEFVARGNGRSFFYIRKGALTETSIRGIRLPKETYCESGALPVKAKIWTNDFLYYEFRLFHIFPEEWSAFGIVFFTTLEISAIIGVIFFLVRIMERLLSKVGVRTRYQYQLYCKKNQGSITVNKDTSRYRYQKPQKRFPIFTKWAKRVSVFLLVFLYFTVFYSLIGNNIRRLLKPIGNFVSALVIVVLFLLVTILLIYVIYKLYYLTRSVSSKTTFRKFFSFKVKKYRRGDKRYDS